MLDNLIQGSGYKLTIIKDGQEELVYAIYKGRNVLSMHLFMDAFNQKDGYQFGEIVHEGVTFEVGNYGVATGHAKLINIELI